MNRVAKFYRVSFEQFLDDYCNTFNLDSRNVDNVVEVRSIYDRITLPRRSTKGSAGYDFISPIDFTLNPGETIKIPTCIKCEMENNWVLKIYPRSGLGFKYRLQIDNTVGIIDSDYFYSDNEGHIMLKLSNNTNDNKVLEIKAGDKIVQGIFVEYGITIDDDADGIRNGGFGSTGA